MKPAGKIGVLTDPETAGRMSSYIRTWTFEQPQERRARAPGAHPKQGVGCAPLDFRIGLGRESLEQRNGDRVLQPH